MSENERMDAVAMRLAELYEAFYRIIEILKLLKFPGDEDRLQELILELEFDLSRLNDRITLAKNWRLLANHHAETDTTEGTL